MRFAIEPTAQIGDDFATLATALDSACDHPACLIQDCGYEIRVKLPMAHSGVLIDMRQRLTAERLAGIVEVCREKFSLLPEELSPMI